MNLDNRLKPTLNDGRYFFSPILGCLGACAYCYLSLNDYRRPRINEVSIQEIMDEARKHPEFVFGENGTIISIGAWGDIFPLNDPSMVSHSVAVIKQLLTWGNPMQIMSKNVLSEAHVLEIADSVQYSGQLLYSTTITTLREWEKIEPLTSPPLERLETCKKFCRQGIPTNVLLKPFFESITGAEIEEISDLLIKYGVDYCTIGVLYWDEAIYKKISSNSFMRQRACFDLSELNHLDCAGESQLNATRPEMLRTYIDYLRGKGIAAFLKSSCVSSNVLNTLNKSNYYESGSHYCINCGNCNGKLTSSFL